MPTITTGSLIPYGIPAGATVGVYDGASIPPGADGPPKAAAITTAVSAADGTFTVTNAGILANRGYVLAVAGATQYVRARSTLDVSDVGRAAGTASIQAAPAGRMSAVTATSGRFAVGQRVSGTTAGIVPPGTYITALAANQTPQAVAGAAATDVFTATAHGFSLGDPVMFTGLTGGAGLTAGNIYHVTAPTTNTFKVSTTQGGAAVDITSDLTVGTVQGIGVMSNPAIATGAQNIVAEGASPPSVGGVPGGMAPGTVGVGIGATLVDTPPSTWQARVRQRRQLMGTS